MGVALKCQKDTTVPWQKHVCPRSMPIPAFWSDSLAESGDHTWSLCLRSYIATVAREPYSEKP
jgi:hypothetical protein